MADNFQVTAGSGVTIASDDVGGAQHQRVKAVWGADGAVNDTSAAAPFPVGGSGASCLGKLEDAAHTTGDVGVGMLGVVTTDNDGTSATDGDYAFATLNALGALRTQDTPNTTGGLSIFRSIDIDETEEEVKATAGMVYNIIAYNNDSTNEMFLKFYNDTAANVVVGTTTPVLTFPIAASQQLIIDVPKGIAFSTAITVAATTGVADSDTGAPDANDVLVNVLFK
jgi:hypothetical protein